uniref:Uncharacterized protein n=1 Tax=Megaselia scalaris TaxID=36166 RepID=T1GMM2_MEGSC
MVANSFAAYIRFASKDSFKSKVTPTNRKSIIDHRSYQLESDDPDDTIDITPNEILITSNVELSVPGVFNQN